MEVAGGVHELDWQMDGDLMGATPLCEIGPGYPIRRASFDSAGGRVCFYSWQPAKLPTRTV